MCILNQHELKKLSLRLRRMRRVKREVQVITQFHPLMLVTQILMTNEDVETNEDGNMFYENIDHKEEWAGGDMYKESDKRKKGQGRES